MEVLGGQGRLVFENCVVQARKAAAVCGLGGVSDNLWTERIAKYMRQGRGVIAGLLGC